MPKRKQIKLMAYVKTGPTATHNGAWKHPASELGDHSYVAYWNVDDVDQFYREVADRGALVGPEPADKPWGLREFGLRTPDGHRITCGELMQRD